MKLHATSGTHAAMRASSLARRLGGRAALGLCAVLALTTGAFLAPSASAQTAYECTPTLVEAEVKFKDAHCKESGKAASGYKQVGISPNTPTPITLNNITTGPERSILKLKSVQLEPGEEVSLELQATEVEGIGSLENRSAGSETWLEGNNTVVLRNTTVTSPVAKGCVVTGESGSGGVIPMKPLRLTQGFSNEFTFSAASGGALAVFTVEGCSISALNHTYSLTGKISGATNGATTNFTHAGATSQGTLLLSGRTAGLEGSIMLRRESTGNGIALTNNLPGQTAYECAPTSTKGEIRFEDAHCKIPRFSGEGWKHVAIAANTSKEVSFSNTTTGASRSTAKLKSVQAGITFELQATEVEGTGSFENLESGSETKVEGSGSLVYRHVTVTLPAGKGCKVKGSTGEEGVIPTKSILDTTKGLSQRIEFTPASGGIFAEFTVSGCSLSELNHIYTVTGSVTGNTTGTTISFTHTETTGTFKLFGQKAGLEGQLTVKNAATGNGLALT